ncbi:hypothetical protein [Anthocerotibacter panamensis]|uniref:hypothetical protein n=1 Tax=Anthocerotibacter panamensis TaxID=2857077 RepID=UPI001C4032DA|nr:hypothetical protein [Anthocerotibacter panamensis]
MEISQQQMVMAMAVQSGCYSLLERIRQMRDQNTVQPESVALLLRAGDLSYRQLLALQQCLINLAHSAPTPATQTHSLRLFGLTQQAYTMVSQFNLDRKTLLLGTRSAPQSSYAQIAHRIERSLDTWEAEVIGAILILAAQLQEIQ